MHVVNRTPCQIMAVPMVAQDESNYLVVVVKATFKINAARRSVSLSKEQREISTSDRHWGDPASTSVKYPSDVSFLKPATDIGLVGHAYASGKLADSVLVSLKVGALEKNLVVFGDRYWDTSPVGASISSPEKFERIPLVYENAYGGSYLDDVDKILKAEPANPVGKGLYSSLTDEQPAQYLLPNIEAPGKLITERSDKPPPWCCGFIPQGWLPRKRFIGTYDEAWMKNRNPLLPKDFDTRAFLSASDGMVANGHLQGGEPVELLNVSSEGPLRFNLPHPRFDLETMICEQRASQSLQMDTVIFEPDDGLFSITWTASIPIHWNLDKIRWIRLGFSKQKSEG